MIDKIFLTLFLDGGELPARYPPMFQENLDSLTKMHPGADVRIFSLNEARAFVARNFDAELSQALDALTPYAFKSDLVRYALLHAFGGLYADVSVRCVRPVPVAPDTQLLLFKDERNICPWAVSQAMIYAQPGRPEFLDALRRIVADVKARRYGATPLCPTGPNQFGRAVAAQGRMEDISFGVHRYLTPGEGFETPAFLVEGELIALKMKHRHGDISSLGFYGANNYNEVWAARRAFGETRSQWRFADRRISCEGATRAGAGVAFSPDVRGRQTYGPYLSLKPGAYEVSLTFDAPGFRGGLGVEVTAEAGRRLLSPLKTYAPDALDGSTLRFALALEAPLSGVEIRTYNEGGLSGVLREIAVAEAGE